jgi:hypothetical protein
MRAQVSGKVGFEKDPALAGFCARDFSRTRFLKQGDGVHVQEAGGFFDVEHAVPLATAIDGQGAGRWLLNSGIVQLAHGTHLFGGAAPQADVRKRLLHSTTPTVIGIM